MNKIFTCIFIFIFSTLQASAWDAILKVNYTKEENLPKTNEEYVTWYASRIYDNFTPQKHFMRGKYRKEVFYYILNRNGSVQFLSTDTDKRDKFAKYCISVIENTKAIHFPETIQDEYMLVMLTLDYYYENAIYAEVRTNPKYKDKCVKNCFFDDEPCRMYRLFVRHDGHFIFRSNNL